MIRVVTVAPAAAAASTAVSINTLLTALKLHQDNYAVLYAQ